MPIRVEIHGEESAVRTARRLIRAGDGSLAQQIHYNMRGALAGVEGSIRASAQRLPSRNGLADDVARSNIRVTYAANASAVRALITARHRYYLTGLNAGTNIHPLFGNRRHWYRQAVRPGWFTDPVRDREDDVRAAIVKAVKSVTSSL